MKSIEPASRLRKRYFAGRILAEEIRYFAFPRTGSHYFVHHCLNGLFDLIMLPHDDLDNPEALSRQDELNFEAHYALDLREDGVPLQPLYINANSTGTHGFPAKSDRRRLILIRHPLPALYSLHRVSSELWGSSDSNPVQWLEANLQWYVDFYTKAFELLHADPSRTLLVRYESLVSGPEALDEVVRFVGLRPKLTTQFVHWVTQFDRFVRRDQSKQRTFYRAGRPDSYRYDEQWSSLLESLNPERWAQFGYGPDPLADLNRSGIDHLNGSRTPSCYDETAGRLS